MSALDSTKLEAVTALGKVLAAALTEIREEPSAVGWRLTSAAGPACFTEITVW